MHIRPLPPLLLKKSQSENNEDSKSYLTHIFTLKEWIKNQPHLNSVNPCDQWLMGFLRGSKFNLEKTKAKLDMCYTARTVAPEIFRNRSPFDPTIQKILNLGVFLPLTVLESEDSCRICIQRLGIFDGTKYRFVDFLKVCFMIVDILILEDDNFIIAGENLLVDLNGVNFSTLSQWTPTMAKKCVMIFEKALPVRMKSVHILHIPSGFKIAYNLLKMFLGKKLKERFNVYSNDFEAMYDVMPRDILPKEYGGGHRTMQELTDYWKKKVESYSEWYQREELACSDESLRADKPNTSSSIFGVEGSFRKLQVD